MVCLQLMLEFPGFVLENALTTLTYKGQAHTSPQPTPHTRSVPFLQVTSTPILLPQTTHMNTTSILLSSRWTSKVDLSHHGSVNQA